MAEIDPKDPNFRQAIKEGLTEWVEGKFAAFGKWSATALAAAAFAGLVYLALRGWFK